MLSSPARASNSPDSSHSLQSTAGSSFLPPPLLRLHGVIFTHHQDAAADECQQYTHTHKAIRIQRKSTFITGDNRYVLFYKISFRNDPVNLFGVWL